MFRAVVSEDKIKRLIRFFNAIEKLTDEACFWISEESFLFRDLDTARISMIDFELQRDYFLEYEFSGEKTPVCVPVDKLADYIKACKNAKELEFSFEEGGRTFNVSTKEPYHRFFAVPMMTSEEKKEVGTPNVPFKATFKITTSSLKSILDELRLVDDKITITAQENAVTFSSRNEEGFESSVTLKYPDHIELMAIAVEEPSTASYNLKSILNVIKELYRNSGVATVQLGTNLPLKIDFELIEYEKFIYYLAPRAE